jgi:hypothetical protein
MLWIITGAIALIFFFGLWLGFAIGVNSGLERGVAVLTDAEVKKQRELAEVRVAEIRTNQDNYLAFLEKCKRLGAEAKIDLAVN